MVIILRGDLEDLIQIKLHISVLAQGETDSEGRFSVCTDFVVVLLFYYF